MRHQEGWDSGCTTLCLPRTPSTHARDDRASASHAAARSYRWWSPPTWGSSTTLPSSGPWTTRGASSSCSPIPGAGSCTSTSPSTRPHWTAQQISEAFPSEIASHLLIRDRDQVYGPAFKDRVEGMGIEEVLTAPRSPWQNPFAERVIGSIRRECLDHVVVLNEVTSADCPATTSSTTIVGVATAR